VQLRAAVNPLRISLRHGRVGLLVNELIPNGDANRIHTRFCLTASSSQRPRGCQAATLDKSARRGKKLAYAIAHFPTRLREIPSAGRWRASAASRFPLCL